MRRNISVPRPEWLELRLSTPACRAYLGIIEHGPDGLSPDHFDQHEERVEAAFNRLSVAEREAIGVWHDLEYLENDIASYISRKSYDFRPLRSVGNVDEEREFIQEMRKVYVYPDYLEVVGAPQDDDFTECRVVPGFQEKLRTLTYARRADLLVLGAFPWRGMYIAKADDAKGVGSTGWQVCLSADYIPVDWLCATYNRKSTRHLKFHPFRDFATTPLHEHLFTCDVELGNREPLKNSETIGFLDGNPFNCLPENLVAVPKVKRGRKMICHRCHKETTAQESTVVRDRGGKARYCNACIRRVTFIS